MHAPGSIGRSPARRIRRAAAAGVLGIWIVALFPVAARADDCPITDLNCTLGTVGDPIDVVTGAADDTTKKAKDAADTTTATVTDVVDGLTGGTHEDPPPVDGGRDHGGNDPGTNVRGGSTRHRDLVGHVGTAARTATREAGATTTASPLTVREVASTPRRPAGDAATAARIRAVATGIAVALLVVVGGALAFVALQDRVDRRDPKLLLAPVTEELLTFG